MKPAPFTYHRPRTREDVDRLLANLGEEARILAGRESLIPILNMRLAAPAHLIDINGLEDEAREPRVDGEWLAFGPVVRQEAAERLSLVGECAPLLRETIAYVAHPAIRSRGTIVGSIAHADPAGELPALLLALCGEARVRGAGGRRTVPADALFAAALETSLHQGEWIEEVRLPRRPARTGFAAEEFARRHGDYALCGVLATAHDDGDRVRVALVYRAVGDVPTRVEPPALSNGELGASLELAVSDAVSDRLDPADDLHAQCRVPTPAGRAPWRASRAPGGRASAGGCVTAVGPAGRMAIMLRVNGRRHATSRQTYVTGGAVKAACEAVRERLLGLAAERLGRDAEGLSMGEGGSVQADDVVVASLVDLLDDEAIEETAEWHHNPTFALDENGQGDAYLQLGFSAHRAVVDVDTDLGLVRVVELAHRSGGWPSDQPAGGGGTDPRRNRSGPRPRSPRGSPDPRRQGAERVVRRLPPPHHPRHAAYPHGDRRASGPGVAIWTQGRGRAVQRVDPARRGRRCSQRHGADLQRIPLRPEHIVGIDLDPPVRPAQPGSRGLSRER